jgi:thioester reductase-like protein
MTAMRETIFVTGATGLIGGGVLHRLLKTDPQIRAVVLVRDLNRWAMHAGRFAREADRITAIKGDVTSPGLGMESRTRSDIARKVTTIVHAGADTSFSRSLEESRATNTVGTAQLLDFASECSELERLAYVSTAFVAGRATGTILERDNGTSAGWVNAYEQSKYEAECVVRASESKWTIFRPSTVACQGRDGVVTQINAVHRALKIYHRGLAAMMPGTREDQLDVVTADYVCEAIARLTLDERAGKRTFHLCSGKNAASLGTLLDTAYDVWARDASWKKRRLARAILTDLETYGMFERAVMETGNPRLRGLIASLSHFVPQLALPKVFDTTATDELLDIDAPPTNSYWEAMLLNLLASGWTVTGESEEVAA